MIVGLSGFRSVKIIKDFCFWGEVYCDQEVDWQTYVCRDNSSSRRRADEDANFFVGVDLDAGDIKGVIRNFDILEEQRIEYDVYICLIRQSRNNHALLRLPFSGIIILASFRKAVCFSSSIDVEQNRHTWQCRILFREKSEELMSISDVAFQKGHLGFAKVKQQSNLMKICNVVHITSDKT